MFVPNSNSAIGFYHDQIHQRYQRRLEQMEKAFVQEIRKVRIREDRRITEERNTTHSRDSEETGEVLPGGEVQGMEQTQKEIRLLDRQEKLDNKTLAGGD